MLSMAISTVVQAAPSKPAKMTCADFIALDDVVKPKVVYWAEGFNKSGKPVDSTVDVDETDKLVPMLVTECKAAPKDALSKRLLAHATKPAATSVSPKPANMTCSEFIALDDVMKPKVVYWAAGFNKKGKPADSAVDVVETDKLVPVLVTECKASPQLNFWQKFVKHL
jgi:hypothetical protein